MFAVAVVVCAFFLSKDANKVQISTEFIYDLMFTVVLAGVIGARVFFILLNFAFFLENPLEIIMIQKGGLAFQGGFIGAALAGLIFIRQRKQSIGKILNLVAPYIALGHAIGRLGCFLNGCCYGKPVSWGIYFPVHDAHLHPTQLYEAFGLVVLFFILKKIQSTSKDNGIVFVYYLLCAAALRFSVEFYRADHFELYLGLSVFQWMCVGLFVSACMGLLWINKKGIKG